MNAVLYVGHGSRVAKGNEQLTSFIHKAMEKVQVEIQEICFIELTTPTISEGIDRCVEQGAEEITVVPVLLLSAGHAKIDIPNEINEAKKRYPSVQFTYGRPFGISDLIISIVGERLEEQGGLINPTNPTNPPNGTVLLVGRGSSNPDTISDFEEIGRLVQEQYPVEHVETCYLAATTPTFEEGIQNVLKREDNRIFIVPYLLFTGILLKKMERVIRQYQSENKEKELILCHPLGYHPKLVNVLVERVHELL